MEWNQGVDPLKDIQDFRELEFSKERIDLLFGEGKKFRLYVKKCALSGYRTMGWRRFFKRDWWKIFLRT